MNPIIERELVATLRQPKSILLLLLPAAVTVLLVLLRWPTDATVGRSGQESLEVFRVFAYGQFAVLLLLVPAFPATAIVREKRSGTLALLLNSPMSPTSIYIGKLLAAMGMSLLPLIASLPAAAACYAMGGIKLSDMMLLYLVYFAMVCQLTTLSLYISTRSPSTDASLRTTYAAVVFLSAILMGPYLFFQGSNLSIEIGGLTIFDVETVANLLRCFSPLPAVMHLVGDKGKLAFGMMGGWDVVWPVIFFLFASAVGFVVATMFELKETMFDKPRASGLITQDRSQGVQWFRRLTYLVDPQRRSGGIGPLTNPVMAKEFRTRKFGRLHWLLRIVAVCAIISLLLTIFAVNGVSAWNPETIGGIMVMLQVVLIVMLTPSLAAGLISSEHESGGWTLLQMTPLRALTIVIGKLLSVAWTLILVLLATLPGYVVMIAIKPVLTQQILLVLVCLVLASLLSLLVSAAVSSFFRRSTPATITAYGILSALFGLTMLIWAGRDAPFGHSLVENVLRINPMAAALSIMNVSDFGSYNLVPINWWLTGGMLALCLIVLTGQTWRLTQPR